ncbi:hypothetical protein HQ305_19740 [Rhodococcus sp. BP-149]|uniref:LolA family protein n=1 Tax=unclassified Rhodococcus (in: high G+C Gram-positive bacteria) TaxID=192944 RepID=UPI001C9B0582|nr:MULTISPECIES: hypothetical protein [unclassified Rhodococcus (in: high G+C Gram-positive bacteria)]MBY6687469.1 hypothetical protein [Rhodococcus sp. BP-288]MBY6696436.1 hypothetical protein [Rhodococcus sp. BP-188]MBY6700568.1 hypothetical protein [Rhodococcus sp. BP-285]MBY6704409.1 hypothetical protein [Rhodococcus sp. BP-283]MBY6713693.1 hypothetical protein [Rhodococcus sp. BP-160]
MTDWTDVLHALTSPTGISLRGTIRETPAEPQRNPTTFKTAGHRPMFVRAVDDCTVWLRGASTRVEYDGRPVFVTDGTTAWDFTPDPERPLMGPVNRVHYFGKNQFLIRRRTAAEWAGTDFTSPTGPIDEVRFLERDCWTVELAPPPGKPHPMRIWVDIETGRILGHQIDLLEIGARYVDVTVGEPLDDGLFTWTGPTQTHEERQRDLQRRGDEARRQQAEWFAASVTGTPVVARVPVDFTPTTVPFRDDETGAFEGHNDQTMIARSPRSADGSWSPRWGPLHYVWSTPEWDWAAAMMQCDIDDDTVHTLQSILHPDASVDRQRRIDPPRRGRVD